MSPVDRRGFLLGLLAVPAAMGCGAAPLVLHPDPVLRQPARPVARVDAPLRRLAERLRSTMTAHAGYGLAAPQIGVSRRVVVVGLRSHPLVLVNPVLLNARGEFRREEGCLSLPEAPRALVLRKGAVTVAYQDLDGRPRTLEAEGPHAAILQHELDHLDGRLYIDYPPA